MSFERGADFELKDDRLEKAFADAATEFHDETNKDVADNDLRRKIFLANVVSDRGDLSLLCSEYERSTSQISLIFDKIVNNVMQMMSYPESRESKEATENIPVTSCTFTYDESKTMLTFHTMRQNETVKIDVRLRKYPKKTVDKAEHEEQSDEYSIRLFVHKKLAQTEDLKLKFSQFLSSGKHFIEFIFDTVWPSIDAAPKEKSKNTKYEDGPHSQKNHRHHDDYHQQSNTSSKYENGPHSQRNHRNHDDYHQQSNTNLKYENGPHSQKNHRNHDDYNQQNNRRNPMRSINNHREDQYSAPHPTARRSADFDRRDSHHSNDSTKHSSRQNYEYSKNNNYSKPYKSDSFIPNTAVSVEKY